MASLHLLQDRFLELLPRIEMHAKVYFRDVRCLAKRADRIAETIALAWHWFVRLAKRGKDATQFASVLATLAARAVKCGRRLAGMESAKDVMNPATQQRHDFIVEKLPDVATLGGNILADALTDNVVTPPPDAAAFRIDFPRWLTTLSLRDRRLAEELMTGERAQTAARRFALSPARVTQVRQELCANWKQFHDE